MKTRKIADKIINKINSEFNLELMTVDCAAMSDTITAILNKEMETKKSCSNCSNSVCKENTVEKDCTDNNYENWQPDFEAVIKPVIKYLAENHHPHTKIMIDSNTAELLEGQKTVVTDEFIVD